MNAITEKTGPSTKVAAGTDKVAGLALLIFPILYGGFLIGDVFANRPAPRLDARGRVMPDLFWEAMGYLVTIIVVGWLGHLVVFLAFRWRLCRSWTLRAIGPLQLAVVALCVAAPRVFGSLDPFLGFVGAPIVATALVYGVALVVVRRSTA
ncbi:MAG TPA: hypothetical protein VGJ18_01285 [Gemmatimonadaceae bacterium]|jgi:hypothetical protein